MNRFKPISERTKPITWTDTLRKFEQAAEQAKADGKELNLTVTADRRYRK